VEHTWKDGRCIYCGASQSTLDRGEERESHAYAFIHTDDIKVRINEIFGGDMQFDVIIGNPPYQLASDGGTRDIPIYQYFVEQAKRLQPRYLVMVIPSRWMASGLGLGEFRRTMLADQRIRELVDFPISGEVFPGVEVKGGVCYFLWDAHYRGLCRVTTMRGGEVSKSVERKLDEFDIFVRDSHALSILHKVLAKGEKSINTILARDKEFGWTSNFAGFHEKQRTGDVPLHYIRKNKRAIGYIARPEIVKSAHLIDTWKVLVPKAGSDGGQRIPDIVLGKPLIASSPSVCTQSYLFFHVGTKEEAQSVRSYYMTRFFRFLVSLRKITQDATHATYMWVPIQTWDRIWTDEILYEKYGITPAEQAYIASMIRPMAADDD
jgi:site-specific DNA-methyltransferase (adenine-specific)